MIDRKVWAARLANAALAVLSTAIAYFAFGIVLMKYGPYFLATSIFYSPIEAAIWAQASAPDPDRQDYVALLGDSNARGVGDWRAERRRITDPYHSADVIRDLTGRNILSFGILGVGSSHGLVGGPARALSSDRCLVFSAPRPPQAAIYYFYEGNDFDNNIQFVAGDLGLDPRRSADEIKQSALRYYNDDMSRYSFWTCLEAVEVTARSVLAFALGLVFPEDNQTPAARPNRLIVGGRTIEVPLRLQSPSLELDEHGLEVGAVILDASLQWFRSANPNLPTLLVYVPSVLTVYDLADASVSIQTFHRGEPVQPAARVTSRSDDICRTVAVLAAKHAMTFFDARTGMREAARSQAQPLHGPRDWSHPNRVGYTTLGTLVAGAMNGDAGHATCAKLSVDR